MEVDRSTRRDADGVRGRRSRGTHRASRRGPSPLLVGLGLALVAGVLVVGLLVLGGSPDPGTAAPDEVAADSSSPSPSAGAPASAADAGSGGSGPPAAREALVAPGEALAGNTRLQVGPAERAELEEGRVDIRVLSMLALLGADHELGVADFSAPGAAGGPRPAYVVDLDAVDGGPVTAQPGQDVARVARDQLGVFRPADVSVRGDVLRIEFAVRDSDELPPVPLS